MTRMDSAETTNARNGSEQAQSSQNFFSRLRANALNSTNSPNQNSDSNDTDNSEVGQQSNSVENFTTPTANLLPPAQTSTQTTVGLGSPAPQTAILHEEKKKRVNFTRQEDRVIVRALITEGAQDRVSGNKIWDDLLLIPV